ncbi:5'-nucleotidase [Caldimonas tepidiphila]|uniref:5'-nucleotidase n=1 Tax=Caldimonas tepidiphila TaxID=2315841 RepID=UPI00196AEE27|nr:5'-nucleotidase [Caldimonas tepidiphila]
MFRIAVSARALFDLESAHEIFVRKGAAAFDEYMRRTEGEALPAGPAFGLVRKLLGLNVPGRPPLVDVALVSRSSPQAGTRLMRSLRHHRLGIERCVFTQGRSRQAMLQALDVRLFLSRHAEDVRLALSRGLAAATLVMPSASVRTSQDATVRIAFDGDAVLFSDEAELVNRRHGVEAFVAFELRNAHRPLGAGPFRPVIADLARVQKLVGDRLAIALVTARGATCHERVTRTLHGWGVRLDEAVFCCGAPKGPILGAMEVDLFLDDGLPNIESAARFVPCGHVPYGAGNALPPAPALLQ